MYSISTAVVFLLDLLYHCEVCCHSLSMHCNVPEVMHMFIQHMVYLGILHKVNICNETTEKNMFLGQSFENNPRASTTLKCTCLSMGKFNNSRIGT